jgi:uncharacterized membrane protein YfcA
MWTIGAWAALVLSAGIGLSLGLVGGGGSIITVPVLVYVAGIPVKEAVALSLAIVGATAAVGAVTKAREGRVDPRAAALFGITGMVGAVLGAQLTPLVPPAVLLVLFALLMVAVGVRMIRGQSEAEAPERAECHVGKCGLAGLGVGVLTGFLGVGGGFLIVPALLRFARMPMHRAVGTSLAVIAANAASGFAAHRGELGGGLELAAAFTAAAVAGVLFGSTLGRRMKASELKTAFGGVALAVAAYLLAVNIGPLVGLVAHGG